jgi:hypothetical protein
VRRRGILRVVLVVPSPSSVDSRRGGFDWRWTTAAFDSKHAVHATSTAHHRDQQGSYGTEEDLGKIVDGCGLFGDPAVGGGGTAVLLVAAVWLDAVHDAVVDELVADARFEDVLLAAELFREVGAFWKGFGES